MKFRKKVFIAHESQHYPLYLAVGRPKRNPPPPPVEPDDSTQTSLRYVTGFRPQKLPDIQTEEIHDAGLRIYL